MVDPSMKVLAAKTSTALRSDLQDMLVRDLLGPAGGPLEELDEATVRDRYLVGALASRRAAIAEDREERFDAEGTAGPAEDGTAEPEVLSSDSLFPSSMGMTFSVAGDAHAISVRAAWGWYQRGKSEHLTTEAGNPKTVWRRTPIAAWSAPIALRAGKINEWVPNPEQPGVKVTGTIRRQGETWMVTLFLVNDQQDVKPSGDQNWLFQPDLEAKSAQDEAIFRRHHVGKDPSKLDPAVYAEELATAMAYRHQVEFAVGHGVAVHAEVAPEDPTRARRVSTRVIPVHEVARHVPPRPDEVEGLDGLVLDMKRLGEMPTEDLVASLECLPYAYGLWISGLKQKRHDPAEGLEPYHEAWGAAVRNCATAEARIRAGIEVLATDPRAAEAFRFANRAMALQRVRSLVAEARRHDRVGDEGAFDVPSNRTWYPFQLAFILINLPGLADPHHPERSDPARAIADLLWFPTGGGKTEAYLGLAAFALGVRRLQGDLGGRSGEHGLVVLMRYTLRLLTIQQFQRAAALLCACEVIRTEALAAGDGRWGEVPFRIGLWVGMKTTPNTTDQAQAAVSGDHGEFQKGGAGTPAQLTNCPWCGTKIQRGKHIRVETTKQGRGRTLMYCGDAMGLCPFSEARNKAEGLPVVVVDEEIYRRPPAMLIATVDKFAQLPWKGATQTMFGQIDGACPRHGFRSPELEDSDSHPKSGAWPAVKSEPHLLLRPPDLIIQDELHLISGPLGTLVGLYETAVDELSTWTLDGKAVRPKLIASTATIRQARDQVRALYRREVAIFPPQGTDVADNFFARQLPIGPDNPGRRYLGICAPGRRLKAALIRTYVAALASGQTLYEERDSQADPWMTLVGYFNSMRELGSMRRLVEDDVRSRLREMPKRGLKRRGTPLIEELTSRRSSDDIPDVLDRLEMHFNLEAERERIEARKRGSKATQPPIDVLLATNMIAVGVDVKRLGLMAVAGQPKGTAEYIQATSRVGRSHPGLVLTVYNWARPRDLSHYETFEHYHATFYQHVEALSVTPFSPRALDRGLTGVLAALIRLASIQYNPNVRAQDVDRQHPIVTRAVAAICDRAAAATLDKDAAVRVRAMIEERLDLWRAAADRASAAGGARLGYEQARDGLTLGLLMTPGVEPWGKFTCPTSLREVEPTVPLILDDYGLDGGGGPTWTVPAPPPQAAGATSMGVRAVRRAPAPVAVEGSYDRILADADPAVHGLLAAARTAGLPPPTDGHPLPGPGGDVVAEAELAWEDRKHAVFARDDAAAIAAYEARGWTCWKVAGADPAVIVAALAAEGAAHG